MKTDLIIGASSLALSGVAAMRLRKDLIERNDASMIASAFATGALAATGVVRIFNPLP